MDLQTEYFKTNFSPKNMMETLSPDMQVCIQNCQLCHQVCQQVLGLGLERRGRHVEATHLKALFDCSQLCRVSSDFMLRGSALHAMVCESCAQACLSLSMSCEKFGPEDKMMKVCLEVTKRCEESCRRMARMNH